MKNEYNQTLSVTNAFTTFMSYKTGTETSRTECILIDENDELRYVRLWRPFLSRYQRLNG